MQETKSVLPKCTQNSKPHTSHFNFSDMYIKYKLNAHGIIHVGAHEAEELKWYLAFNIPKVCWIEANPVLIPKLQEIVKPYKHHNVLQGCVASATGEHRDFYITNNIQSSSYLPLGDHKILHPNIVVNQTIRVNTSTLPDLVKDFDSYDMLSLDIQGAELDALKGIGKERLKTIKYIYTEINTSEVYKQCGLLQDLDEFLSDFKRVEAFVWPNHTYGEALYIRKDLQ